MITPLQAILAALPVLTIQLAAPSAASPAQPANRLSVRLTEAPGAGEPAPVASWTETWIEPRPLRRHFLRVDPLVFRRRIDQTKGKCDFSQIQAMSDNIGTGRAAGDILTVADDLIAGWAGRHLAGASASNLPRLTEVFRDILGTADRYVRSESGSICLVGLPGAEEDLVYVAAFGSGAAVITGARLPVTAGITGRVYREGRATLLNDVRKDGQFFAGMDEISGFTTRSILAVPVAIGDRTIGVISLFNRLGSDGFLTEDLELIEVLGGYASNSLLNYAAASHHREIARRDDLTGLRNDRYFHQRLRVELELRERDGGDLSLLFLDLDRFKSVVDTHGHLVGSQVLAEVGRLMGRLVEHPGATVARYGGDEFVVILPDAGADEALVVAGAIRQAIADTVFLAEPGEDGRPALGLKGQFSASIGVASYRDCPFAGSPPADWKVRQRDFIQIADEAMYQAKRLGRDRVCLG